MAVLTARKSTGSTLAQFAPCLLIALVILFAMMDMTAVAAGYAIAGNYTSLEVRNLAATDSTAPADVLPAVHANILEAMKRDSVTLFLFHGVPDTSRFVSTVTVHGNAAPYTVTDSAVFRVPPFIAIPCIPGVPGLSTDFVIKVSESKVCEALVPTK